MSTPTSRLLAGALAACLTGSAAHATVSLQGGGSTLLAPYWAQTVGCWDNDTGNGSYISGGTLVTPFSVSGCSPTTGTQVSYAAVGSGPGQAAVFAHDGALSLFGSYPTGSGSKVFPTGAIQYGLSENGLADSDIGVYSVGTGAAYAPPGRAAIVTPASYQGLTFGSTGSYPVAKPLYGALLQFPIAIVPVAITYNRDVKSGVPLNVVPPSGLRLDATAYCKIFSGVITDWSDPYLTTLNSNTPLAVGPAPITLVGDANASGVTSIFTRHLAAACDSVLLTNPYTAGTLQLPVTAPPFTKVAGGAAIATAVYSTPGSIGYVGTAFVLPAVLNNGLNSYNLPTAQLKNAAGADTQPNGTTAAAAFASILPPSTAADRADATSWVQGSAKTVPLANPTAAGAYPIVGTTNFIGYSCYASVNTVNSLRAFLNFGAVSGGPILGASGLAPMPSAWNTAISNAFVNPINGPGNAGLNLYFAEAVSGANGLGRTNNACKVAGVVGG